LGLVLVIAGCGAESTPEADGGLDAGAIDGASQDTGCPVCACPALYTQQVFTCDDPLPTQLLPARGAENCSCEDRSAHSRAYRFRETMDRQVTFQLDKWNVCWDCLEGFTVGSAVVQVFDGEACVGPALVSDGSISFTALANHDYTVVVESVGKYALWYGSRFTCNCPMGQAVLACNSTIVGTTAGGGASQLISSWMCQTPLDAPGPEMAYALRTGPGLFQHYDVRLTGASDDLDLFVSTPEGSGICDPHGCVASSATPGTSGEAIRIDHSNLDVFVDSRTQGGPFQLEVDCSPACPVERYGSFRLQCDQVRFVRRNLWGISNTTTWGSCAGPLDGAEIIYSFRPSVSGRYSFALTGMQQDLDLIALPSSRAPGRLCDPTVECLASSTTRGSPAPETVTFDAVAGEEYLLAVDGPLAGVSHSFELSMKSPACSTLGCAMAGASLRCPGLREERRSSHDPDVAHSLVDAWPCAPDTTGSEIIYELSAAAAGTYTVTLDELTTDLDLVVVRREVSGSPNVRCVGAATCAASSLHPGTASEVVSFDLAMGEHVFVAVESRTETPGPFHIMLSGPGCP